MTDGTPWGGDGHGTRQGAGDGSGPEHGGGFGPPAPPVYGSARPPYPATPACAPPPASRPRRATLLLALAGVATAVLVAGLLIASPWSDGSAGTAPGGSPVAAADAARMLREAADNLEKAQVLSYRGEFARDAGSTTPFDLQTTPGGWGRGSLGDEGLTVRMLTAGDNRLAKADQAYWKSRGYSGDLLDRISGHWLDAASDLPEIDDLTAPLAPANVAALLRDAAGSASSATASPAREAGRAATLLSTPGGRFSISDSAPHTLLRLASGSSPAATGPLPLAAGTDTSVSVLTGTDRDAFTTGFEQDLTALRTAVDPTVTFTTVGKARFSPCGSTSCTARFTLQNSAYGSAGAEASADAPVHAEITIDMTLDGRKIKRCAYQRTMQPSGSVALTCTATYTAATSSDHTVRGVPDAWARAVPDDELTRLREGFAKGTAGGQAA
ncbi:hypothetical protein [Streptomyces sp. MI02-7b]|uniref:hypothetical protein n=1 Tax=Streptomyces sp. MI02-7b TaxID=462941 RepID=UPI0029A24B5B|nr:hypothetical protein [Streptomyces sp. MI02-7b]MDX3072017.1 hypothetical protein [Streptomyces sp. MI02-7b]